MTDYYKELGLSANTSLSDIQTELDRLRRKWASKTNAADEAKRREAENKVKLIDEAIDTIFVDEASRSSYDRQLAQEAKKADDSSRKQPSNTTKTPSNKPVDPDEVFRKHEEEEKARRAREAAEAERRRQREAEQAEQRRIAAIAAQRRRRKNRFIRFVVFLLILAGVGYYYNRKHITPIRTLYFVADTCMTSGDYKTACLDYFEVNDQWYARFLFKDAYDKAIVACTSWLGQEPIITTTEDSPWWSLDRDGNLDFDSGQLPSGTELQFPTVLDGKLLTTIGEDCFSYSDIPSTVDIPANYTTIGSNAFYSCSNLSAVTLHNVEIINSDAFSYCDKLTAVTLNHGLREIGQSAFAYTGCLSSITIPGTVGSINERAFYESGVTSLQIDEGNAGTVIGEQAFAYCNNLTTLSLSSGITEIGNSAFCDCEYLNSVSIGNGVTTIGENAFSGDSQLSYLLLGENLQTIGASAFRGTGIYGDLTFPASMTYIGESAFEDCNSLTHIYTTFGTENMVIGARAFYGCDYLLGAELPGVVQLGDSAFDYCESMYWVTLDNALTSIGAWCFSNDQLTSVYLSESLQTIGEGAFHNNNALENIEIPAGVGIIECSTFTDCTALEWIIFREGITIIRDGALGNNPALTDIFYSGDEAAWYGISVGDNGPMNDCAYHFNFSWE